MMPKLCINGAIIVFYAFYILRMRCSVHCIVSEHGRRDTRSHIELDKQASVSASGSVSSKQFPSSDIVAQFTLPPIVTGFGSGSVTSTSTLANFANRTNVASSGSGVGTSANSQTKNYFTHLTFDYTHNVLYAGATNKILKLNENLRVLSEAVTGPKHDAPQCHAGDVRRMWKRRL